MMQAEHFSGLVVLDFGSQYTQLIARLIRELGVFCSIKPFDVSLREIEALNPLGIILSGGPETVTSKGSPRAPQEIFSLGLPILGICYGMQTMAVQLGGDVRSGKRKGEFGRACVRLENPGRLLKNIEDHSSESGQALLDVWMSHGDSVVEMPPGFECSGSTSDCSFAAMSDDRRKFYGLQFHPEVTQTHQGKRILGGFALEICGCSAKWTAKHIIDELRLEVNKTVGAGQVLLGLSGGVDSAVTAVLLHKMIGQRLTCLFIDTGLLRLNERQEVEHLFSKHLNMQVVYINAADRFLSALSGVQDPEEKRRIIGHEFIRIFEEACAKRPEIDCLAQGTIYSDVIESAGTKTAKAHKIKSHHNVGGLPKNCKLKIVEPLRYLFKDEVKQLGLSLGLPSEMIDRHPFPGPGLAVRILGEVKPEYVACLQQADAIFIEELRRQDYYHKVSQAFCVFLPIKSVGVKGDKRHYNYVIALRAVETSDFMSARWARLPEALLDKVAHRIVNETSVISRVVYDISGKPPATIEWE